MYKMHLYYKICYLLALILHINTVFSVSLEKDLTITLQQKLVLDKFRDMVVSDLPHEYMKQDIYLIRWLRAKEFDIVSAKNMLYKNLEWRKKNRMDDIMTEDFSDIQDDYKYYIEGVDNSQRPVAFWDLGAYDFRKTALSGKAARALRYMDRYLEEVTTKVRTIREKEGLNITQYSFLLNMDGFNLVQHLCLQCVPMTLSFITSYEHHYPGECDKMFLVNTPAAFEPVLQILKTAMSPLTKDSVEIYGRDKAKWQNEVFKNIRRDQLPPSVGGTALYAD